MTIITVKVSDSERTLKEKHLLDPKDEHHRVAPGLEDLVAQAIANFGTVPDDITVNINIPW